MSSVAAQGALHVLRYGAQELKAQISTNTIRAFRNLIILILLAVLLSVAYRYLESFLFPPPNVVKVLVSRSFLEIVKPPVEELQNEPPPPPPPAAMMEAASGPAERAGTPVAVPDALVADLPEIASVDVMDRASNSGNEGGVDNGGFAAGIGEGTTVAIQEREEIPDENEFMAVEQEVAFDLEGIKKNVKYPENAMRLGIQGKVNVAVLVGKDGSILNVKVTDSDNVNLNQAAIDAIRKSTFIPAKQNGQPVTSWVRIPIDFKLR